MSDDYKIRDLELFGACELDSRVWGPVPEENIIGRPFIRFIPLDVFPGEAEDYQE